MPVLDSKTITDIASGTSLDSVADYVRSSRCILFLGSGVHFPSPRHQYLEHECPPLGGQFSARLADKCRFRERFPRESPTNLQRVSLCYEIEHSRAELVEEVRQAVQVNKRPSPALLALAKMPFSLIVTTNYDRLFEEALHRAGKRPRVGIYSPSGIVQTVDHRDESTPDKPFVFKLHGDIETPESIVLTDEDYIQFVLRMGDKGNFHPVPETFRYLLKRWPTLFVGYSLLDYNLRLLFKTLRWKLDPAAFPPTYSVDPSPDPLIFDVMFSQRRHVTFIAKDVWTFVPELYSRVTGLEMPI